MLFIKDSKGSYINKNYITFIFKCLSNYNTLYNVKCYMSGSEHPNVIYEDISKKDADRLIDELVEQLNE
jgi:hypothetical protein